jgi:hypothetical protein
MQNTRGMASVRRSETGGADDSRPTRIAGATA